VKDIPREFEVFYSFKDIHKAQKELTFSIERLFLAATMAILFGVMEFLLIISTSDSDRDLTVVLIISILVAILTFIIGLPVMTYAFALYFYKFIKSASLQPQITQLTDDGVVLLGKMTQNLFFWKFFNKIQRRDGLIELYKDKKMVLMFPSGGFKGHEEEKAFFEICEAKIQATMTPESDFGSPSEDSLER
jgi:hypothetical protein